MKYQVPKDWKLRRNEQDGHDYAQALLMSENGTPVLLDLSTDEGKQEAQIIERDFSDLGIEVFLSGNIVYLHYNIPSYIRLTG
jgi:hypothetical protein